MFSMTNLINKSFFLYTVEKEQSEYTRNRRLSAIDLTPRSALKSATNKDKVEHNKLQDSNNMTILIVLRGSFINFLWHSYKLRATLYMHIYMCMRVFLWGIIFFMNFISYNQLTRYLCQYGKPINLAGQNDFLLSHTDALRILGAEDFQREKFISKLWVLHWEDAVELGLLKCAIAINVSKSIAHCNAIKLITWSSPLFVCWNLPQLVLNREHLCK